MPDTDIAERHHAAYARPDGFGKSLFGGKAFGKIVDRFACLRKFQQLFRAENALRKCQSEFFVQADNAFEGNNVCTNSVNHGSAPCLNSQAV